MPHATPLISTIVAALVLAFLLGAIANRLKLPPIVGYLLAGVLVGPNTPGFVADQSLALELSEIGVILLMFGVGLHFSLKDLLAVRTIALPGALGQIAGATVMGLGLALFLGWSLGAGLLFGLALSVASTVVLLKALQDRHILDSDRGRIAIGWLIVEDLAMVLALVLIPPLAGLLGGEVADVHDPVVAAIAGVVGGDIGIAGVLLVTAAKLGAFFAFMLIVGRRVIPWVLHQIAHTGSRELFRLAVLAIALGVAAGAAYVFGVSLALGAFFAGMILSESELSHRAAEETLPLRDAFAVLFFVAVGMLFDPMIIIRDPLPLLATVAIIVLGKSLLAYGIVTLFRLPRETAAIVAVSLAQIGEFSFILAALGVQLALLPAAAQDLILGGAIISILLNPLAFWLAERLLRRREHSPLIVTPIAGPSASLPGAPGAVANGGRFSGEGHTILIGYGRVGSAIATSLAASGEVIVVIEDSDTRAAAAVAAGLRVVPGNGAVTEALELAGLNSARQLFVAIPNVFEAGQAVEQARRANPAISIVARAHSDEEAEYLRGIGANHVVMGETEIGLGMVERMRRPKG